MFKVLGSGDIDPLAHKRITDSHDSLSQYSSLLENDDIYRLIVSNTCTWNIFILILKIFEKGKSFSSGDSEKQTFEAILLIDIDCASNLSNLHSLFIKVRLLFDQGSLIICM